MTRGWIGALLIAATALTPIAASAQDGGFGTRVVRGAMRGEQSTNATRDVDRAPRAERQAQRRERQAQRAERRAAVAQNAAPAAQAAPVQYQRDGRRGGGNGDNWQGRRGEAAAAPVREQRRADIVQRNDVQRSQVQGRRDGGNVNRGTVNGGTFDRNDNGRVDRRWDNNNNGRVDRQWDRNRDGQLDRRWDRNDNERLDRRYDRNRDGNLDRRYDRDRDGRANRYDRYDNRSGYTNNRNWNRSWRDDRRYDWRSHRQRYGQTYRLGRYYSPYRNYSYRSLSIGFFLDSLFYSDRYWINNPYDYRLPDVYGPYRWVRYYDDALLVDIQSGEVVDVINNFFW